MQTEEMVEEQLRQSDAGQRVRTLRQELSQTAGFSETEIDDLRTELANQQRQKLDSIQDRLGRHSVTTETISLEEILGTPLSTESVPLVGWISPDDSSVAVRRKGTKEPTHIVRLEEDYTVFRGGMSVSGNGANNKYWATLTVWLYYSVQPPKRGMLTVRAFPSLHGGYQLSADDWFPTNAAARTTGDYLWAATQKGKQTGIIHQRFLEAMERNGTTTRKIDRIRDPVHTTLPVAADEPVYLQFGFELYAAGVSSLGQADLYFYWEEELGHRIIVPPLYWTLEPL
ncbi:hypothetical protein [Halomarina ordinaria]|nr:hypothetical protein [Halomarina sp. PSRA2]